jgi:hypothetical protein
MHGKELCFTLVIYQDSDVVSPSTERMSAEFVVSSALHSVGEFTWDLLGVKPFCFLYEKVKCVLMP